MKRAVFLTAATVLAWVPSLRPYIRHSDDLRLLGGIGHYFHRWGVWRIVGHLPATYTDYYPFAVLGLLGHVATVLVIYYALSKIVGNDRALFAGTVLGTFPFCDEAILWSAAFSYVLCTAFFWAAILTRTQFWLCLLFSLLCAFSNESLLIALFLSGLLFRTIAPPLASVLYYAAFKLTVTEVWQPVMTGLPNFLSRMAGRAAYFNPRSLVSVWAYQYYQPWRVVQSWGSLWPIMLVLVGLLAVLLYRSPRTEPDWRLAVRALILMMGASLAYAIVGGFSLQPRKEYPLLPLLLFFICSLMPVKPSRWAVAVLSVIGLVSTWLVIWNRDLVALGKMNVG